MSASPGVGSEIAHELMHPRSPKHELPVPLCQTTSMLRDTSSDQVRLTSTELGKLRRRAARYGESINEVRTQDQLLESTLKATDPQMVDALLKDLEQFVSHGHSPLTACTDSACVEALLRRRLSADK